jgi:hypothetical protein
MDREAAQRAHHPGRPPARPRRPLIWALSTLLLAVIGWNLTVLTRQPQVFSPEEEAASAKVRIYLVAVVVLQHRDSTGALPATLEALGLDDEHVTYVVADSGFQLSAAVGEAIERYQSGEDLTRFGEAYRQLDGTSGGGR